MSEPALAWTATLLAKATTVMTYKLYMGFTNQDTLWNAWSTWATASGSAEQKAIALKFSGRAVDLIIPMDFIPAWPKAVSDPQFVTKWSGACVEDWASSMGGFCLLEDNGTDLTGTSDTTTALAIY